MTVDKILKITKQKPKQVVTNKKIVYPMNKQIGKLLAQRREELKLSQKELANKIKQNITIISVAEKGEGELSQQICIKLNEVLGKEIFK